MTNHRPRDLLRLHLSLLLRVLNIFRPRLGFRLTRQSKQARPPCFPYRYGVSCRRRRSCPLSRRRHSWPASVMLLSPRQPPSISTNTVSVASTTADYPQVWARDYAKPLEDHTDTRNPCRFHYRMPTIKPPRKVCYPPQLYLTLLLNLCLLLEKNTLYVSLWPHFGRCTAQFHSNNLCRDPPPTARSHSMICC